MDWSFPSRSLDRRRFLHIAASAHPMGDSTARQVEAARLPEHAIRFLIHDRDQRFKGEFPASAKGLELVDWPYASEPTGKTSTSSALLGRFNTARASLRKNENPKAVRRTQSER